MTVTPIDANLGKLTQGPAVMIGCAPPPGPPPDRPRPLQGCLKIYKDITTGTKAGGFQGAAEFRGAAPRPGHAALGPMLEPTGPAEYPQPACVP